MSFGTSIGDVIALTQLAWKTVTNTRKACGEYDDLTQQVSGLHVVLSRLQREVGKPESLFQRGESWKEELGSIATGCNKALGQLNKVLDKYNALSEKERSRKKLWQQIKFGNGQIANIAELRGKLTYYSSASSLFLNMISIGSMGRVEKQMDEAGCDLREIKLSVNGIVARLMTQRCHEGSVLTAYADDDRAVWKEFRRELIKDGFSSSTLRNHQATIKAYVTELGSRGLFDEGQQEAHLDGTNGGNVKADLDPGAIDCDQREEERDMKQKWTRRSTPNGEGFEERDFRLEEGDSEVRVLDRPQRVHEGNQESTKTNLGCTITGEQEAKTKIDSKGEGTRLRANTDAEGSDHLSDADHKGNSEDQTSLSSQDRAPVKGQGSNIRGAKFLVSPTGEIKLAESSELDKFHEIEREYYFEYRYRCQNLIADAYDKSGKDHSDCAVLSETIMEKILLKLDALDAQGNDKLRILRKDLVIEVQNMLYNLDELAKLKPSSAKSFDRYWHVYYEEIAPECITWARTEVSLRWHTPEASEEEMDHQIAKSRCIRHLDAIESYRNVRLADRKSLDNLDEDIEIMLRAMSLIYEDVGRTRWVWSDERSDLKGTRIILQIDSDRRVITSRSGTRCQQCYPCPPRSRRTVPTGPTRQPRCSDKPRPLFYEMIESSSD